jgi:DNA-binding NtrC family response regulator
MASVLVSEVERDVRRLLTTLVERQGHEAIVLQPDVVVPPRADVLLAEPASPLGTEHVRLVRAFCPELPLICMSALPVDVGPLGRGPIFFLPKPFTPDRLAAMIERALEPAASPV